MLEFCQLFNLSFQMHIFPFTSQNKQQLYNIKMKNNILRLDIFKELKYIGIILCNYGHLKSFAV